MVSLPSHIIPVYIPAGMNADAVSFPKGVFPPDADFRKGGHVPATHPHGSGGVQRGRTVGSSPLGRFFWYFSARGRKVQLEHVPPTLGEYTSPPSVASTARALQGQRTLSKSAWAYAIRASFRLNSLHERRSRNMMARAVRRELSVLSNFIPAVKRPPKTSFREPFVPQTPHRDARRAAGAGRQWLACPAPSFRCTYRRV